MHAKSGFDKKYYNVCDNINSSISQQRIPSSSLSHSTSHPADVAYSGLQSHSMWRKQQAPQQQTPQQQTPQQQTLPQRPFRRPLQKYAQRGQPLPEYPPNIVLAENLGQTRKFGESVSPAHSKIPEI